MDDMLVVIYRGKCNYYVLINYIRHCGRGEFIQNCFKIFSFLLIWNPILVDWYQNTSGYIPVNLRIYTIHS